MGNSLRCCIACMLPCGALDVVRVVHVNGHGGIQQDCEGRGGYEGSSQACNQKVKLPRNSSQDHCPAPDAELERGNIYFLIPTSCLQNYRDKEAKINGQGHMKSGSHGGKRASGRRSRRDQSASAVAPDGSEPSIRIKQCGDVTKLVISEQYLADVLSEKAQRSGRHSRKNSRVGVWRPHLESISEVASL